MTFGNRWHCISLKKKVNLSMNDFRAIGYKYIKSKFLLHHKQKNKFPMNYNLKYKVKNILEVNIER